MVATEIADRHFQFREGCDPYPYHERRLPNICLEVNTLTPTRQRPERAFFLPGPALTPSSQSFFRPLPRAPAPPPGWRNRDEKAWPPETTPASPRARPPTPTAQNPARGEPYPAHSRPIAADPDRR